MIFGPMVKDGEGFLVRGGFSASALKTERLFGQWPGAHPFSTCALAISRGEKRPTKLTKHRYFGWTVQVDCPRTGLAQRCCLAYHHHHHHHRLCVSFGESFRGNKTEKLLLCQVSCLINLSYSQFARRCCQRKL